MTTTRHRFTISGIEVAKSACLVCVAVAGNDKLTGPNAERAKHVGTLVAGIAIGHGLSPVQLCRECGAAFRTAVRAIGWTNEGS